MNNNPDLLSDKTLDKLISHKVIDLFIRVGLIGFLVVICYQIFRPCIGLILWSIILAVAMYPLHVLIARKMGGRDGRAATALVLAIMLSVLTPTTLLAFSFADSTTGLVKQVQSGTLQVPAPNQAVAGWPVVGDNLYSLWSAAHTDLGSVIAKYEPKIAVITKQLLGYAGLQVPVLTIAQISTASKGYLCNSQRSHSGRRTPHQGGDLLIQRWLAQGIG